MAYAITASKWLEDKRYIEAVLDSADDLAALGEGYAPDSRAIVADGGAAYMTDASGIWQELGSPGGGGGSSVTVEPLTVTANGTTTAPSGKAYSPVTTNVPNSYGASDEGKVVNNGALVAQTAHAPVTQNGTIDTTLYNSVPVNVDGNPNYVETISGTLGDPWGGRFSDVVAMLEDKSNYTVLFKAYGAEVTPDYDGDCIYWAAWFDDVPYSGTPSTATVYSVSYGSDGTLLIGRGWFVNAWSSLNRNASTKITIIHHPMTGSLTPAENQTFGGNV